MAYGNKTKDWTALINSLKDNKACFPSANGKLLAVVDTFCHQLNSEDIVHSNVNSSGKTWRSKSLIASFCELFDPILKEIFPAGSYTCDFLSQHEISLPFSKIIIQKESCRDIADKITHVIHSLEKLIPLSGSSEWLNKSNAEWDKIIEDGESLELIAGMLFRIFDALNIDERIYWCEICFRRRLEQGRFCKVHLSKNDTDYKKGLRIRNSMPDDMNSKWQRHRSVRIALGDNFLNLSRPSDIPDQIPPQTTGIFLDAEVRAFIEDTTKKPWSEVHQRWDLVLKLTPSVNQRFGHLAFNFNHWDEYRLKLLSALENSYEQTKHPYWIFMMIAEAEDWLSLEKELSPPIGISKTKKILELISQGFIDADIAKKVGVSRGYVGRIRGKNIKGKNTL